MLSGHDIICISIQDWDDLWTRKQRFMSQLARQGNRVLYVEQQVHILGYIKRLKSHWKRIKLFLDPPRKIDENLYIYNLPIILPFFQMFSWINTINYRLINSALKKQIRNMGFKNPILWTYAPFSDRLVGKLGEKFVIYECVDEFSASKGLVKAETVRSLEEKLIKKSDLVIVTAQNLLDTKRHIARNIHLISNAAEIEHFRMASYDNTIIPEEMEKIKHPIIGFLGSIAYWIDIPLIQKIALSHPEWSIVLIGPVRTDISKIESLKNVHLLGRKDYQKLPGYLKAFDICINPYILDGVAEGCSPIKLYEYLATGKPIVSVDMPEASNFKDLIKIAKDNKDFIYQIELSLKEDENMTKLRLKESEKHSWNERFKTEESIIQNLLESKSK